VEPPSPRIPLSGEQASQVKLANTAGRVSEVCMTQEVTLFMYANISAILKKHAFSPQQMPTSEQQFM